MKKRGQLVLIAIITLVVAIVVGITLPMIAKSLATGKTALKEAYANDIALIIDTIYASPYEMEVEYETNLGDFVVEINKKSVKIHDAQDASSISGCEILKGDRFLAEYSFVPVNDDPCFILDKPKKLLFSKNEDGKLTITSI